MKTWWAVPLGVLVGCQASAPEPKAPADAPVAVELGVGGVT